MNELEELCEKYGHECNQLAEKDREIEELKERIADLEGKIDVEKIELLLENKFNMVEGITYNIGKDETIIPQ